MADHRVVAIADRFASAAVDGSEWLGALRALAEVTGSSHGQLIGIGGPSVIPFNWVSDLSTRAIEEFVHIEGGDPMINPRVAVAVDAPVLSVRSEADYRAVAPLLRSDIYADFCRDHDIPFGCQTKLTEDSNGLIGLAVLRNARDGPTSAAQRRLFTAIAPHVRSAVRIQAALEHQGLKLVTGALESVAAAVFICEADARIRAQTPAAEDLLRAGRLVASGGRLAAPGAQDARALRHAIAEQAGRLRQPAQTLALAAAPGSLPLLIDICAAPDRSWDLGFKPQIFVIARSGRRWHGSAVTILALLYGLSVAEADVALRLAQGEAREAIAEARNARLETVRAQLKSAFAKLGINREVELVAMLGEMLRI